MRNVHHRSENAKTKVGRQIATVPQRLPFTRPVSSCVNRLQDTAMDALRHQVRWLIVKPETPPEVADLPIVFRFVNVLLHANHGIAGILIDAARTCAGQSAAYDQQNKKSPEHNRLLISSRYETVNQLAIGTHTELIYRDATPLLSAQAMQYLKEKQPANSTISNLVSGGM